MINTFLKYKIKNINSTDFTTKDIDSANKILFALFTRYGDTIIDTAVIKEFIQKYPHKEYLILCPKQMIPYINELLPNVKVIGVNKRNLFDMIKVVSLLKKEEFDLGFNPWSNGIDSCYFISFCKKFLCYKEFKKPEPINHYEVVRLYLKLPSIKWSVDEIKLKDKYKNILICPQSTDEDRSISNRQLKEFIEGLKIKYENALITIAAMDEKYFIQGCSSFRFKKSKSSSQEFLNLVKSSDLAVCTDSGPLHIATALKKDVVAVFNITKAEIVLKNGSKVIIKNSNELSRNFNA